MQSRCKLYVNVGMSSLASSDYRPLRGISFLDTLRFLVKSVYGEPLCGFSKGGGCFCWVLRGFGGRVTKKLIFAEGHGKLRATICQQDGGLGQLRSCEEDKQDCAG